MSNFQRHVKQKERLLIVSGVENEAAYRKNNGKMEINFPTSC